MVGRLVRREAGSGGSGGRGGDELLERLRKGGGGGVRGVVEEKKTVGRVDVREQMTGEGVWGIEVGYRRCGRERSFIW